MALSDPNDFTVRPDIHRRAKEKRIELKIGRAIIAASLLALFLFSAVVIYSLINQGSGEPIVVEGEEDIRVSAQDVNREAVSAPPGSDVYVLTQQDSSEEGVPLQDILSDGDAPPTPVAPSNSQQGGGDSTAGANGTGGDSESGNTSIPGAPRIDSTPLPRVGEIGAPVPSGWYVQLSSFGSKDKALKAVATYSRNASAAVLKDNPLFVYTLVLNNGKTAHRVVTGPGSNSSLMKTLCADIKKSGLSDCLVIRVNS